MGMFEYEEQRGKVECEECPSCGRPRPIDWFVREGGPCWRCRALGIVPAGPQGDKGADCAGRISNIGRGTR